jgi:hypothetical protein
MKKITVIMEVLEGESPFLKEVYYTPSSEGSLGGVKSFIRGVKEDKGKELKLKEAQEWLSNQNTYTLHKQVRRKFPRNKIMAYGIDNLWQADLVEMIPYASENDNYRYILVVIDVFSKYMWVRPLYRKNAKCLKTALQSIFNEGRVPKNLQSDEGLEFKNRLVKNLLDSHKINYYNVYSDKKCAVVERVNRTLKSKMWRYFSANNTYRYIDILQDLVTGYLKSVHSSIGMRPIDVKKEHEKQIYKKLYGDSHSSKTGVKFAFKVGDTIRIVRKKDPLEKGYKPNFSEELFKVTECVERPIPVYRISDLSDEPILGTFYKQEMVKVPNPTDTTAYKIEKILDRKKIRGKLHYLIKWWGYPMNHNSWIPASNVKKL